MKGVIQKEGQKTTCPNTAAYAGGVRGASSSFSGQRFVGFGSGHKASECGPERSSRSINSGATHLSASTSWRTRTRSFSFCRSISCTSFMTSSTPPARLAKQNLLFWLDLIPAAGWKHC